MMKRHMNIYNAIRFSTLKAAAGIVIAMVLMAQYGQTVTLPGLPGTAKGALRLVSLNVGNSVPYLAHDRGDDATENKVGLSSVVFPPVQSITPGKRGESSATILPFKRDTVYSEPLSCYPGCKLA